MKLQEPAGGDAGITNHFQTIVKHVKDVMHAHGLTRHDVRDLKSTDSEVSFKFRRAGKECGVTIGFASAADAGIARQLIAGNNADVVPVNERPRPQGRTMKDSEFFVTL